MSELSEIIKATLFVAGEAIEKPFMAEKLNVTEKALQKAIDELKGEMGESSGIQIVEFKNKVQLRSKAEFADQIAEVLNPIREKALTKAALETLAIIAYKQPITRLEIEDIRRTGSDYAVNILLEHKLIDVVGRKDAVGKPLLYGTTEEFLKRFGLNDVNGLPAYEELLERIALIRQEDNNGEGLYYEYKLEDMAEKQPAQPDHAPMGVVDIDAIADRILIENGKPVEKNI
ncbi:MAG: SMC-Scp complex subunit ScpB [Clostridia bacterium]|nr:SMC-Scp complex subunit ScpB [Clostridia bacterium]